VSAFTFATPLKNWRVLVPRAAGQATEMIALLENYGAQVVAVPTLAIAPPDDPEQVQVVAQELQNGLYDWVIFTSVNAVAAFGEHLINHLPVKIAVVGRKTAEAVKKHGFSIDYQPPRTEQNSLGLVADFDQAPPGGRVLLPRSALGTDVLPRGLAEKGWEVTDCPTYKTVPADPPPTEIALELQAGGIDAVCVTSGSAIVNLAALAGKPHPSTVIACLGPMAAEAAEKLGLTVTITPEVADVNLLVEALAEYGSTHPKKSHLRKL
jgi:hypothetical protein